MDPQPALTIPPEIRSFLESLLKDTNMRTVDDEVREEMIKELYIRLDDFLTNAIIEHLPEEHLDDFITMNEQGKPMAEMQQFLIEKMPGASQVFATAFDDFRSLYLSSVAVKRQEGGVIENTNQNE